MAMASPEMPTVRSAPTSAPGSEWRFEARDFYQHGKLSQHSKAGKSSLRKSGECPSDSDMSTTLPMSEVESLPYLVDTDRASGWGIGFSPASSYSKRHISFSSERHEVVNFQHHPDERGLVAPSLGGQRGACASCYAFEELDEEIEAMKDACSLM